MKKERCLIFGIPYERKEEAEQIAELLKENNIDFVCYMSQGYHKHSFAVKRCGKKWNDIMHLVNSIYSPVYRYEHRIIANGIEYAM